MVYVKLFWGTRIGNWMFQYAHARKLIGETAPVVFYSDNANDRAYFEKSMHLLPGATLVSELPSDYVTVHDFEEEGMRAKGFPDRGNWLIDGYFQRVADFDVDFVQRCFACPRETREYLEGKYPFLSSGKTLVGLSVRRGDYLKWPHLHPFLGKDFLTKTVLMWPEDAAYIVCSDEIAWCKTFYTEKRFPNREFVFIEGESAFNQIYLHSLCHHNVISNSTFAWWGAFLGWNPGKRVVFPSMWYGKSFDYAYPSGLLLPNSEIVGNGYSTGTFIRVVFLDWKRSLRGLASRVARRIGFASMLDRRRLKQQTPFRK